MKNKIILTVLLVILLTASAQAATFVVNSVGDEGRESHRQPLPDGDGGRIHFTGGNRTGESDRRN